MSPSRRIAILQWFSSKSGEHIDFIERRAPGAGETDASLGAGNAHLRVDNRSAVVVNDTQGVRNSRSPVLDSLFIFPICDRLHNLIGHSCACELINTSDVPGIDRVGSGIDRVGSLAMCL
eukprot:1186981-Prorocentrum_minimum.AAC.1